MTTTTLVAPISLSNDLLTGAEWSPSHTRELLHLSADIKARPVRYASTLHGKFIALIFEKPSLRTRVTFEVGIQSMGGSVIFLDHTQASASLGARESIADVARNLDRWVQGIVARVYHQRVLEEMAANADIPVINALSEKFHPCQALADFFTIEEKLGALRPRSHRGNLRWTALARTGPIRKSHVRAESHPAHSVLSQQCTHQQHVAPASLWSAAVLPPLSRLKHLQPIKRERNCDDSIKQAKTQKSSPRLFPRPRHFHHPSLAQTKLSLQSHRHAWRRRPPGRFRNRAV